MAPLRWRRVLSWHLQCAPATARLPSNNPLFPANAVLHSKTDFAGSYPVIVQRFAFPSMADIVAQAPNFTTQAAALVWYVNRMVMNIWVYGNSNTPNKPIYDSVSGGSKFAVFSHLRGIFDLAAWNAPTEGKLTLL